VLTIGQLASFAGVTVRTVRFYHQKGLLPEPQRDASGYRRYDAAAVVELIRIRTLAEAGVPLSRVRELLDASPEEFAAAVEQIDRRLQEEIRARRRHRARIAQLAAGDSLALPPEVVAYLERMRELGFPPRMVDAERDAWIVLAAQMPDSMPAYMASKRAQLEDPTLYGLYRDIGEAALTWERDDPRLPALADRLVASIEALYDQELETYADDPMSDELAALLDAAFLASTPIAARLLELLEERGWRGWSKLRRIDSPSTRAERDHSSPTNAYSTKSIR
jgi:DNA-binding transcriptional MerR regulator